MKTVLLICNRFPPVAGSGTFRPAKFAKYLPEFDWKPIVLCGAPGPGDSLDQALADELPDSLVIERVNGLTPARIEQRLLRIWNLLWRAHLRPLAKRVEPYKVMNWAFPDIYRSWSRSADRAAHRLVRKYKPDVILTSSPPHSVQLIGRHLRRDFDLPWVVDFRDPWQHNPFIPMPTALHRREHKRLESLVTDEAHYVVSVTDSMTSQFRSDHPASEPDRFVTITNGFDGAPESTATDRKQSSQGKFAITYTGALYGIRTANLFLDTVAGLVASNQIDGQHLDVNIVGIDGTGDLAKYYDQQWFHHVPPVSQGAAHQFAVDASLLLLLVPAEIPYAHSNKLFDYLRSGRPILALAPPAGDAAALVREAKAGWIVPPDDHAAIGAKLVELYHLWCEGRLHGETDQTVVRRYNFRQLTGQMASLLDLALAQSRSGTNQVAHK